MASSFADAAYPIVELIDLGDDITTLRRTPEEAEALRSAYDRGAREAIRQLLHELPVELPVPSVPEALKGSLFAQIKDISFALCRDVRAADRRFIEAIERMYR